MMDKFKSQEQMKLVHIQKAVIPKRFVLPVNT